MSATSREQEGQTETPRRRVREFIQRLYEPVPHDEPNVRLGEIDAASQGRAAAIQAALSHVLSRPDSIRQRAQNAATISSAFAAALVIAGVGHLTRGDEPYRPWTIGLMAVALLLWGLSAGLFVYAVAFIDKDREEDADEDSFQALVDCYEKYADKVRAGTRVAARVSGFALLFTVLAVGFEVGEHLISKPRSATLILTSEGTTVIDDLCRSHDDPNRTHRVTATVNREDLTKSIVELTEVQLATLSAGRWDEVACSSAASVRIPRASIRATRVDAE